METIMQYIPLAVSAILLAALILTVITNIITQVVKKITWNKIPTNILAVVVAMAVTLVAFFAVFQIMGWAVTWYMVAGAVATGHRAMTATSGPGFSLGQEAMSYMSAADLPAVIVEIMRAGPADGEILAAQGDYFQAVKGGGHGDYNNLVLAPYSVQEYCDMIQESFELAEKYHNPPQRRNDCQDA